jgi:hypothetical protein
MSAKLSVKFSGVLCDKAVFEKDYTMDLLEKLNDYK